MINKKEN